MEDNKEEWALEQLKVVLAAIDYDALVFQKLLTQALEAVTEETS